MNGHVSVKANHAAENVNFANNDWFSLLVNPWMLLEVMEGGILRTCEL